MNERKEGENKVEVRCTGMLPADIFGYMDWDNPTYGYWSETEPRDLSYEQYHGKYEVLYQEHQFEHGDIPKLFDAFLSENDQEFRRYVVICVSRLKPTQEVFADLISRSHYGDIMSRALSVRALGLFSTEEARKELLSALGSDEAIIVRNAAGALAHHPCPEVEKALLDKLHFGDQETVNEVLGSLSKVGTEATERELLKLIENTEFFQRHELDLLATLSAHAGPSTLESLPRLYHSGIIDDFTLSTYFKDLLENTRPLPLPEKRPSTLRLMFVQYAGLSGLVLLVFLYNKILWMLSAPVSSFLMSLIQEAGSGEEPTFLFKCAVVLIALVWALFGVFLAIPIARLALRTWPLDPFKERTRYKIILGIGIVLLIPVIWYFSKTLVDLLVLSVRFATEGFINPTKLSEAPARTIQLAFIQLNYSSFFLGIICIFLWAHNRAPHNIARPFVVFLRRFSGFADRSLVVDIIKSMPKGVPLAFIASRSDRTGNWDPFVWAFGGLRLLHPLRNLPIQIKTTDENWIETVQKLLEKAYCVIIDISDRSPSVEIERNLIAECVPRDRVVALVDQRRMTDESSDPLLQSAIRYFPSYWNSLVPIVVKVGFIIWFLLEHETLMRWPILFLLPFMFLRSVSRKTRKEIGNAVVSAVRRNHDEYHESLTARETEGSALDK